MRTPLLCLFVLLCTCVRAQPAGKQETEISSNIDQAVVYLQGAQVKRSAEASLPAGRSTLVFPGLTGALDPASIQLRTENPALLVLSVSHRLHFNEIPERNEAEQSIYARIDAVEHRHRELVTGVAIAKEEEEVLRANRSLAGTDRGLDAQDLERGVTYHRERITAIKLSYLALGDSLRANQQDRQLLQEELAELGQRRQQPTTSEVVVVIDNKQPQKISLGLSYRVASAGWTPGYDVRVTDINQPIDLRYHANVYQHTGEDWKAVKLILSTGDPTKSTRAPELKTWRLRPGQLPPAYQPDAQAAVASSIRNVKGKVVDDEGMPLVGATILVEDTDVGTVTDFDGHFDLDLPDGSEFLRVSYSGLAGKSVRIDSEEMNIVLEPDASSLDEVVVVGYGNSGVVHSLAGRLAGVNLRGGRRRDREDRQETIPVPTQTQRQATTVNFVIELPYTIPADGTQHRVEIKQYTVPATYHHLAVPKREEDVYLSAVIRDWEQYDLISGDLQLFFEGTYLGTSRLEVEKTADSLLLSLGRDPSVVVTRKPNEEFRSPGGFLSGKQVDSRGWTIAVRNTKAQAIDLTIIDQVPVSADGRVEVELTLPGSAVLEEDTGLVTWRYTLPPTSERKVDFSYVVKYPAGQQVFVE